jgi:cullin-associated NEDD8-dissociated protein 1
MLNSLYDKVLPQLMSRFREREEIVKMEVFSAFKDLMRQSQDRSADAVDAMDEDGGDVTPGGGQAISKLLDVDKVMKAVQKQLKDKSFKTKERCLELLRELILVLDGGLQAYLPALISSLQKCVDKSAKTSLKVEALTLLCLLVEKHPGADLRQHVKVLGPAVLACVSDSNYKISAVALRVCGRLCMATFNGGRLLQQAGAESLVADMYNATFGRLSSQDQDLEVKEAAIITMGKMVACLGDMVGPQRLSACLPVMLDRLKNETTRITTLKVLGDIAKSELKTDISSICSDAVLECSTFLRKNDRALKQAALTALTQLIAAYSASIGPHLYEPVTKELSALVSSDELHLTHLSLNFCSCMVVHAPKEAIPLVHTHVLPRCITLLHSPLLQGAALSSLKQLYATLVSSPGQGAGFQGLLDALLGIVYSGATQLSRQSLSSIAQCVSSLCGPAAKEASKATVQRFIKELGGAQASTSEQVKQLLLHCLGEIGRESDLSEFSLETVVMSSFASASEDTKAAASHALGSLAVGAIEKYLPFILTQVKAQADYRYALVSMSCFYDANVLRPLGRCALLNVVSHSFCSHGRLILIECIIMTD